jgi:hypothetical protein
LYIFFFFRLRLHSLFSDHYFLYHCPHARHHAHHDDYYSFDYDKAILTTSDIDPFYPLDFMQVICPFEALHSATTSLSPICLANSKYANMAQCAIPAQHLAHPFNFSHTAPILARASPAPHPDTNSSSTSVPKVM